MKKSILTWIAIAAVLATSLLLSSCGSTPPTAPTPGIQPQIVNSMDDFSYQITNVANFTGSGTYLWRNTGISANINQSTTVTSGTMTLVIRDSTGTQVYSRSLADNGTFITADGLAGTWTIQVVYNGGSGTVNFRAQKKT